MVTLCLFTDIVQGNVISSLREAQQKHLHLFTIALQLMSGTPGTAFVISQHYFQCIETDIYPLICADELVDTFFVLLVDRCSRPHIMWLVTHNVTATDQWYHSYNQGFCFGKCSTIVDEYKLRKTFSAWKYCYIAMIWLRETYIECS